ncbi:MAG: hypothetical protein KIT31_42690, partial [Deltaproteobacteria bacterium]|nr:hypothetical protein [Deltaproteobacteria bacterium]
VHRGDCDGRADIVRTVPVGGLDGLGVQNAQLSPDERTIVFSRLISTPIDLDGELYLAHRDDPDGDFGEAIALSELNTELDEFSPSLSEDLLTLYFDRQDRAGRYQILAATRAAIGEPFGPPTALTLGDGTSSDFEPYVTAGAIFFSSTRAHGLPSLFAAAGRGTTYAAPERLVALEALPFPTAYEHPVMSSDGLTIYFGAPPDPSVDHHDVWSASRTAVDEPFDAPRAVPGLATAHDERPVWISRDNCRLYVMSDAGGTSQLWLASRRDR